MGFNYQRTARLITEAIEVLNLDLDGLTVYTEAATGGFAATAAIAAAAGAERVFAFADDSRYGTAEEARDHTARLAERVGAGGVLSFPDEKSRSDIERADVLTNTGFVRPIDERMATWLGPNAAVPLMFEPWEFRKSDMDIGALWAEGVPVLGTDESDGRVGTQQYLSALAPAIAFDSELEVRNGQFVVIGEGEMARRAVEGIRALDGSAILLRPSDVTGDEDGLETMDKEAIERLDALFVVDHTAEDLLIGEGGMVSPKRLAERAEGVTVVHVCGPIDSDALDSAGIRYVPERPAPRGEMSYTTGYLGPRPIVDLHTAGLRVGADMTRELQAGANMRRATRRVAESSLALDFNEEFKRTHGYYDA